MSTKVVRALIGCTTVIVVMGAFVGAVIFVAGISMRASQPYKDVIARAQKDPRVLEALGAPVEPGWVVSGRIRSSSRRRSEASVEIPLKGSRQNGSVYVSATQEGGEPWTYHRMVMTPDRGEPIDLLAGSPDTAPRGD